MAFGFFLSKYLRSYVSFDFVFVFVYHCFFIPSFSCLSSTANLNLCGQMRSLTLISLSIDIASGNVCSEFVSRPFTLNTFKIVEKEPNHVHHIACKIDAIFDL